MNIPDKVECESLDVAAKLVNDFIGQGAKVIESKIAADRTKRYKLKHRLGKLFGITKETEKFCRKVAPDGKWVVHHDAVGEYHQFSIWYNRYTPYAIAMMECEDGFEKLGIDFDSINSYFKTCMGYFYIGMDFVCEQDGQAYSDIYDASCRVCPPELPFTEVRTPAIVWCALNAPKQFRKFYSNYPGSPNLKVVKNVLERLNKPIPNFLPELIMAA